VALDVVIVCTIGVEVSVIPFEAITCHRVGVTCTHVMLPNGLVICKDVVPSKKDPVAGDTVRE
jgi:hypothetical protein